MAKKPNEETLKKFREALKKKIRVVKIVDEVEFEEAKKEAAEETKKKEAEEKKDEGG